MTAMRKGKASLWLLTGMTVNSFLRNGSQTAVGWVDIKFLPTGRIKFIIFMFSLNPNCLVKICPAYRLQIVQWTHHIGLSIEQEKKKQGQNYCFEKRKGFTFAVSWEHSEGWILKLLLAGETFNYFLLDGLIKPKKILVTKKINRTG